MEKTQDQVNDVSDQLERLGFKKALKGISRCKKMEFAYSNYLFVTNEKINKFNEKLRYENVGHETVKGERFSSTYKKLSFTPISDYPSIPPKDVLDAIEKAKLNKCFDRFEIAKIEWIKEVKDPIVFGRIDGCSDYFFISQWDDDVKIEYIMFQE